MPNPVAVATAVITLIIPPNFDLTEDGDENRLKIEEKYIQMIKHGEYEEVDEPSKDALYSYPITLISAQ